MSTLDELLDEYFSIGVREGKEGRDHDDLEGSAEATRQKIRACFAGLVPVTAALVDPTPSTIVGGWQPIATADKEGPRMMLGVVRDGKLEEIHIGAYSFAYNEDEEACWWSEQADDIIVPSLWAPIPALSATLATIPIESSEGVKVRPLGWAPYGADMFFAPSIVGDYIIGNTGHWWLRGEMTKQAESVKAAKAAAQDDYKVRILSALSASATEDRPDGH